MKESKAVFKQQSLKRSNSSNSLGHWAYLKQEWLIYVMILPVILYFIIFSYLPMAGIVIAFQNFMPLRGFWDSPWVGLDNFRILFSSADFPLIMKNTILISLYRLIFGFPAPILLALMLNEVRSVAYKKFVQTVSYMPHFLSWVIVGGFVTTVMSINGPINALVSLLGGIPRQLLEDDSLFRSILVSTGIWKEIGWGTLLYLAAIAGVDSEQYEAAVLDGAGRLKQVWHVTIPSIKGTIIILLIFSVGGLLDAGFEQIFLLQNSMTTQVSEIIDTYVYKVGVAGANFSFGAAVGIFKSLVGMCLIVMVNFAAKKAGEDGIW